jgi:ATP-binding cassette, subfamily D (ALD), peroxisomal long-chain fatty acid import protein
MFAYKELLEFAGLTTRLYALLSSLHNLPQLVPPSYSDAIESDHVDVVVPLPSITDSVSDPVSDESGSSAHDLVLVRDLSFKLEQGDHLIITGSNGVGKTAVARVLAGLWPTQGGGEVRRPNEENGQLGVFVVPQRSYMVEGTLLDQ